MEKVTKVISYVDRKPGTVAVIGCIGVVFSSMIDIGQILLYASVGIGMIGLLIYSDRQTAKAKKTKKVVKKNRDYIL